MNELLTVRGLADMPGLGQRVVAGGDGLDRVVLWAHSCEMPDPWNWLGPDELLMTVGLCVPESADAQVDLVHRLAAAGLAGVTIGEDEMAPPLSKAMSAEADHLDFPVLMTDHPVPFVSLARAVAMANTGKQHQQLLLLSKLYRSLTAVANAPAESISDIERIFGITMAVLDLESGILLVRGSLTPPPEVIDELCTVARRQSGGPGASVATGSGETKAWVLASTREALLLLGDDSAVPDSFTMGHLLQAVTATTNHVIGNAMTRALRGEHLLSSVRAGTLPSASLLPEMDSVGLAGPEYVALAVTAERPDDPLLALSCANIPVLARRTPGRLVCWINRGDAEAALTLVARNETRVGVSSPITKVDELEEASRQAVWAVGAGGKREPVVHYESVRGSVVPRDSDSALEVSRGVLGELLEPNRERLLETLNVFLSHDRKWEATADELRIHRQTLAYRLRQIEKVTGRSLQSSADLAALWVAMAALDFLRT